MGLRECTCISTYPQVGHPVSGLERGQTTLTFANLLGTNWIDDGVVQMMAEQLSESACMSAGGPNSNILVAGVHFAQAIEKQLLQKVNMAAPPHQYSLAMRPTLMTQMLSIYIFPQMYMATTGLQFTSTSQKMKFHTMS